MTDTIVTNSQPAQDKDDHQSRSSSQRRYGRVFRPGFWFGSLALLPVAGLALPVAGAIVATALLVLLMIFGQDPRQMGTIWHIDAEIAFDSLFAGSMVVVGLAALAHWLLRTPLSVRIYEDHLVVWRFYGPVRIRFKDVARAFVTLPAQEHEGSDRAVLHLWTRYNEIALTAPRVFGGVTDRPTRFAEMLELIEQRLHEHGKTCAYGLPTTSVTNVAAAARYALHWPHRRILAARHLAHDRDDRAPADHRRRLPSIAIAWLFRPAPIAAIVFGAGLVIYVRWFNSTDIAPALLAGCGVLSAFVLPLWNDVKRRAAALRTRSALIPELLIGHHTVENEPRQLVPAPGCLVDLDLQTLSRPDGRHFTFNEIQGVEYGPARDIYGQHRRGRLMGAWHLAVFTDAGRQTPHEIYSNASADIVKHGDLDAGYAAFNWFTAREIARGAGCQLVLANGRVPSTHVGRPLVERIDAELTRYDPHEVRAKMEEQGEKSTIHIKDASDRFEAWSPLSRLPEHCATPPIWKLTLAVVALASVATGFVAGGLVAGYLLATALHDLFTQKHFAAPGFAMDKDGVWVRGVNIGWDELEESTLMPIAPGPILFAGAKTVTVAGHLGETYHERVLLGCAAYAWIRRNVCIQH